MWIHSKLSENLEYTENSASNFDHCPSHFASLIQALDKLTIEEEEKSINIILVEKKPTKPFTDIYEILKKIYDDTEARIFYRTNYTLKLYILHAAARLLEKYFNDDFLKKNLQLLLKFLNIDLDQTELSFRDESMAEIYGSILARLIPNLCDLAINESFYGDEENDYSLFQSSFLSLIFYVIKTVSLKSILAAGFRAKHLQFLIIHFTKSPEIPKILLAVAQNLSKSSKFYENEKADKTVPNNVQASINYQIYSVTMKCIPLLLKLYINRPKILKTIIVTNQLLAEYGKNNKFSEQPTLYLIKDMLKKINSEMDNSKYRNYRCEFINIWAQLIECHYHNLNENSKKKHLNNIMYPLRKILNKIAAYGAFRKLNKKEVFTRNICFLILTKLINVKPVVTQFIRDHLKYKDSKVHIEQTWLTAIENHVEAACKAFISFIRGPSNDILRNQSIYSFILKVLTIVNMNLQVKNNASLKLDLKILIAIADFFSSNFYKNTLKTGVVPVFNTAFDLLKSQIKTDRENLELFLEFLVKMMQVTFTSKYRPTGFFRNHILTTLEIFDDMINMNYDFKMDEMTYRHALELIKLIVKYFSPDKLVQDYRITFLEILFQIDYNLSLIQNSEESVEFERLVAFFEFKN